MSSHSISSFQAAKTICSISQWTLTNLKLQKLLYLAHMIYMGRYNEPMINNEQFSAWMYGPVLPALYDGVKIFGNRPIRNRFYNTSLIDSESPAHSVLKEIYDVFGQKESWKLVAETHSPKGAWYKNYEPKFNVTIPNDDILEEYNVRVKKYDVK